MITVNTQPQDITAPLTVAQLLRHLQISPNGVAVMINGHIIVRSEHQEHQVNDGDAVDIVRAVAGG